VSRLNYAPKLKDIQITDIKKGIGVFTPKPDKQVSFAALKDTLKKAGYTLDRANITAVGTLTKEQNTWALILADTGQRFTLEGNKVESLFPAGTSNKRVEVTGNWSTPGAGAGAGTEAGAGAGAGEMIAPVTIKDISGLSASNTVFFEKLRESTGIQFVQTSYDVNTPPLPSGPAGRAAPIRVTSPGLTVYKGGAVTPRLYFINQHLGNLEVNRQVLNVSMSYTPSPRVQLEAEVPIARTEFDDGINSGSRTGLGNITIWSKYRFFRSVKTYGDRQAAVRAGLELPTGNKDAPSQAQINAPAFVRQQLTPINGGLSPHFDVAFSQAGGRFIFGGNAEGILRSERDGFRMGHEVRVSTDTEYVLLPRKYDAPGGELFVILETTFVHRGRGHLNGASVTASNSTEYYLAPGLQYAAATRFVVEGSFQFPLVRNTGPLVLRTDQNILIGVRYLF
jgi:hypothetical protein